jgi:hydroxyethylthiazole kinase-like sugar kinase family protein
VSIGILRDPAGDLVASGVMQSKVLGAFMAAPVASGRATQAAVSAVKAAVSAAVARLKPAAIDLYFAGPAAFAVALGHRWNAMPPTQLHEFIAAGRRYVPTALH